MARRVRASTQIKILLVTAAILMAVALVADTVYRTTGRLIQDKQWVARTYEILAELEETLAILDNAEDHQRGYVITGDETYLRPFQDDARQYPLKLQTLRRLLAGNPEQLERVDRLESAAMSKFDQMIQTIETRRRRGPQEAGALIEFGQGKNLMDEIRLNIQRMIESERVRLGQRMERADRSDQSAFRLYAILIVAFLGFLGVIFFLAWRNITSQLEVSAELQKSREQYELAVRGSNDGIWDWAVQSGAVYFSPRWKSMLGYEEDEIRPQYEEFESRLHPDDKDRVLATLKDYLDGRLPIYSVEFRMRCKNGEYRWILARGVALRDESGRPYRMAGSHTDVTASKEAERKLADQNQLLERAMQAERETNEALKRAQSVIIQSEKMAGLGQMVAGVAHEINNPLSFITNNVAILQRDFDEIHKLVKMYTLADDLLAREAPELHRRIASFGDEVEIFDTLSSLPDLLSRTAEGLRRIRRIVNDLRLFARLDEGEVNEADLNAGIASTATIIQGHAKSKGIELKLELSPLPRVTCHAARINQVVMNLISNAIDACDRGGTVTVRTQSDDGQVRIDVIDTGHGIPAEIRQRIFDPFFTTKPIGQGTGLGLSISYGIVHDHGGTITVESDPGKGSRFTVRLPLHPAKRRNAAS